MARMIFVNWNFAKIFELFIVFSLLILADPVSARTPSVISFEQGVEVVEEGSEFVVKLIIPDGFEDYEVLWNAPADWHVNGEAAVYKDYHNDNKVIMEAGSMSGMVSATLYKEGNFQAAITFYTYITVVPSESPLSEDVNPSSVSARNAF